MCRWTRWDGTGRERYWLSYPDDTIYFYGQYIAHGGYARSGTNQRIENLKKKIDRPERELRHKAAAIRQFSKDLTYLFKPADFSYALTWIPPSKCKDDPLYDNRLEQVVCSAAKSMQGAVACEIFTRTENMTPLHHGGRRNPDHIAASYRWTGCTLASFSFVVVVDDVLTTGASYKAVHNKIREKYPSIPIHGVFWAITINDPDDEAEF